MAESKIAFHVKTVNGEAGNVTLPTPPVFSGGEAGLVPASTAGETDKYLRSDGTWAEVVGGGGGGSGSAAFQVVTVPVTKDGLTERTFTSMVGTNIDKVRDTMVVQRYVIPNKSQNKDWTIVTNNGSITIIGEIENEGEITLILGDTSASKPSNDNIYIVHQTAMDLEPGELFQFRAVGIGISTTQISVMWPAPFPMSNVTLTAASASATGIGSLGTVTLDTARTNKYALGFLINQSNTVANRAYLVLISARLNFDKEPVDPDMLPELAEVVTTDKLSVTLGNYPTRTEMESYQKIYHVGDRYYTAGLVAAGFVTGSRTSVRFSIPITIGEDVTGFKFGGGNHLNIRESGRYLAFTASHTEAYSSDSELNAVTRTPYRFPQNTLLRLDAKTSIYVYNSTTVATNNVSCNVSFDFTSDPECYIEFT